MPRTGGVYSPPAGTKGTPNTTIQSVPYNSFVDDLTADANAARPITAGGTGATSASAARTALGVTAAASPGIVSIAGLTTAANQMLYTTAPDVYATTSLTPFARTILDDADAATMRATMGANNASNLTTGTIDDARLPGTMSAKTINTNLQVSSNGTTLSIQRNNANAIDIEAYLTTNNATKHSIDLNRYGGAVTIGGNTAWHAGNDGSGSGLDAGLLEGQNAAFYRNASNLNAGTVNDARLPATMSGKTFSGTVNVGSSDGVQMTTAGAIEITNATGFPYIDFKNAPGDDFDARLALSGGATFAFSTTGNMLHNGNVIWTAGNGGSGSGLDAGLLEGNNAAFYRNASNLNAGTVANARIAGAYNGFTTIDQTGLHTVTTTGEAVRIASPDTISNPFLSFYKTSTRQGLAQHVEGAGNFFGFRFVNEVPASDTQLILTNDGGTSGLRYAVGASNYAVWNDGQGGGGASSGWVKFPNGLILQAGSSVATTNGSADGTISFASTFPSVCLSVTACIGDAALTATDLKVHTPISTTGFSFRSPGAASTNVRVNWIAWGY